MKSQTFLRGAAILSLAAFISKILGAVYRIPYQNITGNEGMYVYQQVYPLYSTLLILATAGVPIVISSLVSERVAEQDYRGAYRVFQISTVFLSLVGIAFFGLLFFGAGQIAEWMGDRSLLTLPIQAVSFAMLILPLIATLRGYFQGFQNMIPTASSQILEQLIRVVTILGLAWFCMTTGAGVVYAGAGAMLGATFGGVGALFLLLFFIRKYKLWRKAALQPEKIYHEKKRTIIRKLFLLSLPICLGSLVMPLYTLVDSFTVSNLLEQSGFSHQASIEAKGIFDRGQPLHQFASFFATSVALSIVPAIVDALAKKEETKAKEYAGVALRWTLFLGFPASIGLLVIAYPSNVMLFEDGAGTGALAILALATIFSTLGVTSSGILQGYGKFYLPVFHMLIGILIKIVGNMVLIPFWDIKGAAISTVLAYGVATYLNLRILHRVHQITILPKDHWVKLFSSLFIMAIITGVIEGILLQGTSFLPVERLAMTITSLLSVLTGLITYIWCMFRFGLINETELAKVPKLERKCKPYLEKWGLLK